MIEHVFSFFFSRYKITRCLDRLLSGADKCKYARYYADDFGHESESNELCEAMVIGIKVREPYSKQWEISAD